MDGLSRPLVLYPTNDIEISDAQVHQRGARGRQYVVLLLLRGQREARKREGKEGNPSSFEAISLT